MTRDIIKTMSAWDKVVIARHKDRPTGAFYIENIFSDFIELHVDTPGAFCGVDAEERGQGEAIAKNLLEMSRLKTPIITVLLGEGGSGGALALAVADRILMLEHSIYSILSPEGFASILWKDGSKAKEAAEVMKITAQDLIDHNIVDKVIKEPNGGAHKNPLKMAAAIKRELVEEVYSLRYKDRKEILTNRYEKFRKMGR